MLLRYDGTPEYEHEHAAEHSGSYSYSDLDAAHRFEARSGSSFSTAVEGKGVVAELERIAKRFNEKRRGVQSVESYGAYASDVHRSVYSQDNR